MTSDDLRIHESRADRRVHAVSSEGSEIVRYDRAGKWYIEGANGRDRITFHMAVYHATRAGSKVNLGKPGGARFDAEVRKVQQAVEEVVSDAE